MLQLDDLKGSFDLRDLGVSREEARFITELKGSQITFTIGMDGSKIQSTLKEIGNEFGSLENMTVANRNIEMFAQIQWQELKSLSSTKL